MEVLGLNHLCSLDSDQCQVIVVPFHAVTESKYANNYASFPFIPLSL